MRSAIIGLSVLLALPLVVLGTQRAGEVEIPDNPLRGRLLFEGKGCVECHRLLGSEPGIGPPLGAGRFKGSFLDLGAALWNHVPGMSVRIESAGLEWPDLDAGDTIELTAFLYFIDYLGRPGDAVTGRRVFRGEGCSTCHVVGGGEVKVGPDLAELERFASPLYVAQEIWNHGPSMLESIRERGMRPPSFNEGDLADLSAYIRQQASATPRSRTLLAPGNPNHGGEVFAAKGCSTCHGADARGGRSGPDLAAFELHESAEAIAGRMWNHALDMRVAMEARGVPWPHFEGPELADLVAFLYFLPFSDPPGDAERGSSLFRERSCADCHAGTATESGAPDLIGSDAVQSPAALVAAMWSHAPVMRLEVLAEGRPWPQLDGSELRDLYAYLQRRAAP